MIAQTLTEHDAALLRALLDDPDQLLLVVDAALCVVAASPGVERIAGRAAAELRGLAVDRAGLFGASAVALREALTLALAQRQACRFDVEWLRDGAAVVHEVRATPTEHAGRTQLLVCARDVSAERHIAQALQIRERAFRTLAENSPDVIVRYGMDGRIVYGNREMERRHGAPSRPMVGRLRGEAMPAGSPERAEYERLIDRALHTGEGGALEVVLPSAGGEGRAGNIAIVAERDDAGSICGALAVGRDVTELVRAREALAAREREFRTLAENSPDNIIRYGLDGRAIYCNREIEQRVAVTAARVVGRTPSEAAPPGMRGVEAYEAQLARTLATGEGGTVELLVPHPNGEMRVHNVAFAAEYGVDGKVCAAVAVGRDVTSLIRMQQELAAREREFRTLAENAGDNIVRWDAGARMRYVNPAMARIFGRGPEEVLGLTPTSMVGAAEGSLLESAILRVAGAGTEEMVDLRFTVPSTNQQAVHQIRLVPERDEHGAVASVLGIGRDISEKMQHLELIESLLHTDPLTQLANRRALQQQSAGILASAERHGRRVGVLVVDLDQFKAINDGIGHSAGDALLTEIAARMRNCLRANDLLVRLGGDEFVVIAPDMDAAEQVGAISVKLHAALAAPVVLSARDVRITASIGVAVYPQDGTTLEVLLAHADTAMYAAKRAGRARTEYYRSELGEAVRRRLLLEQSLRRSCDGDGLVLYFQPQVTLDAARRVVGAEALLRWQHPTLGLLLPDAFIALAEETGLIQPIGRWVLRQAAATAVRWNQGRAEPVRVAVNVSPRQFMDDCLGSVIEDALASTGCKPEWLGIEITESSMVQDPARVQQVLEGLRARDIHVALDDFGTGYSALNYLARFPIDVLKIDKSFVKGIGGSARDDELVKAFIALARALNLSLVAEGVEREDQAAFLAAHGCRVAQGWLFGRPALAETLDIGQ